MKTTTATFVLSCSLSLLMKASFIQSNVLTHVFFLLFTTIHIKIQLVFRSISFIHTHLFLAFTENFESRYVSHVIDVLFFCWKLCRCWCLFICSYGQMTSKQLYLLTSTSVVRKHLYVFVTWQLRAKNCASHYILFLN